MPDINSISSAVQTLQFRTQNEISMQVMKKAAQADQQMADLLDKNAREGTQQRGREG